MQGILFKPDMHKAIRDKFKTQTRRLDHLKEINKEPDGWHLAEFYQATGGNGKWWAWFSKEGQEGSPYTIMPRYQPNEIVYLKEAYATDKMFDGMTAKDIENTGVATIPLWYKNWDSQSDREGQVRGRWRSPMFLPEWAARDYIKITDVRPERLAEISEEDAVAEGCTIMAGTTVGGNMGLASARYSFAKLWDSINKAYPFDGNYWVWPICFNLIEDKR